MVQTPVTATGTKVAKLSRAQRNESTRRKIFKAATRVVGKFGYAEASVARITEEAGVAQGTFYNHFESRQQLLDQLLPTIGLDMVNFIAERAAAGSDAATRELDRFGAFFDYLRQIPEFLRILNEAEFFAPAGYQKHFDNISTAFARILKRARNADQIEAYSDDEIEVIVHIFMGARGYLSRRYSYSENKVVTAVPDYVISAYEKLITRGLFKPRGGDRS